MVYPVKVKLSKIRQSMIYWGGQRDRSYFHKEITSSLSRRKKF
jgi:hypothetical protein